MSKATTKVKEPKQASLTKLNGFPVLYIRNEDTIDFVRESPFIFNNEIQASVGDIQKIAEEHINFNDEDVELVVYVPVELRKFERVLTAKEVK